MVDHTNQNTYWTDSMMRMRIDNCPVSEMTRQENCQKEKTEHVKTNADRIRAMSDEELAEFLADINPTNCQNCAFSCGWRCKPDKDDYSDFEKCKEGRKRWLQQPAELK